MSVPAPPPPFANLIGLRVFCVCSPASVSSFEKVGRWGEIKRFHSRKGLSAELAYSK